MILSDKKEVAYLHSDNQKIYKMNICLVQLNVVKLVRVSNGYNKYILCKISFFYVHINQINRGQLVPKYPKL